MSSWESCTTGATSLTGSSSFCFVIQFLAAWPPGRGYIAASADVSLVEDASFTSSEESWLESQLLVVGL